MGLVVRFPNFGIRPVLVAALTMSLLVPLQGTLAKPKPGSKCSKAGLTSVYKGKIYACQKKKQGLVWSAGIAIGKAIQSKESPNPTPAPSVMSTPMASPTSMPTSTPTPSLAPMPTGMPIPTLTPTPILTVSPSPTYVGPIDLFGNPTSEEALKIDKLLDAAWAKGRPATQWLKIRTHERVKGSTWAKDNEAVMPAITQILDGVGAPLTREVEWFVWWDLPSLQPLLGVNCWARYTEAFRADAVGAGYCRPSTTFIFYEAYQQWYPKEGFLEKYPNEWDKYGITAVAAGEVAHFAQQIYGERFGHEALNFLPAWLREGPAVLFASLAYAKYANIPYSTVRNLALRHNGNYSCKNMPMTDLLMFNTSPSLCEYSGGFLAVEYLVAKQGDLLAPFRYLESKIPGNGERCSNPDSICRPSYESVIREIYSKDVDGWHAEISTYVKKWALGK